MGTIGSADPRISNKNHENSFGDFVKCSEVLHLSVTANQMTWKNMFNSCCFWKLNWKLPHARMLIVYHVKFPTNIAVSERASYWSDRRFKGPMVVHFILYPHTLHTMMTSLNGNIFRITGPLWGEFTGPRWIPLTKDSDAELWCFLWSAPE